LIQKRNLDLLDSNRGFEYSCGLDRLFEVINKTKEQCLADVRADAIDKFTASLTYGFLVGDGRGIPQDGFKYAQQLRDKAK